MNERLNEGSSVYFPLKRAESWVLCHGKAASIPGSENFP